MHGDGVLGADVHITLRGADGIARDGHGFDDNVGVALQHAAVHKCAGVALVGVAAYIFLHIAAVARGKLPFAASGETCAAAAAQAGVQDRLDDVVRRHFSEHLAQRLIAVKGNVFVDVLGVDNAAVAQRDAHLFFIKRGVVQALDGVVLSDGLVVQQARDGASFQQVLVHDLFNVLFLDHAVKAALGIDDDDGAQRAQAEAARADDLDFIFQAGGKDLVLEGLRDLVAAGGGAAGAAADHYMASKHCFSSLPYVADGVLGDGMPAHKMLGHDARDFLGRHFYIGDLFLAGAGDLHHRLVLADADAARLGDEHAVQVAPGDLFGKGVQHRARACGDAAGGHADHDARGIVRRFPRIHGLFHLVADGGKFF